MKAVPTARTATATGASGFKFGILQMVAAAALLTGLAALTLATKMSGPDAPARVRLPSVFQQPQQRIRGMDQVIREDSQIANPAFRAGVAKPAARPGATPLPPSRVAGKAAAEVDTSTSGYHFKVVAGPSPSPYPTKYNMRGCTCKETWASLAGSGESVCECGGVKCPAEVNPRYLTDAWGQDNCSVKRLTGFSCTAKCTEDGKVLWFAEGCGGSGQKPCPELVLPASATPSPSGSALPTIVVPRTTWDPQAVYDFRGGGCELLNGKQTCYMEDGQGREICPEHVTLEYLTRGPPEYRECAPDMAHSHYCTIICQAGNPTVRWGVHHIEDCHKRENFGNCPPRPSVVPKADFKWVEWTEKKRPETACQAAARRGDKGGFLPELSVGLLTHEPRSFAESMDSYEKHGFFDVVPEFIIYINNRNAATEEVAERWRSKYPDKIRILGTPANVGITRGLLALTEAATKPYFLFLERDFYLIEPQTCVYEQLQAGIDLVKANAAQVVRYRHRWRAGRPNWAYRFFHGHEIDAFRTWQPNLGCNVHYWLEDPVGDFPQYFWKCGDKPEMLCSDSYYCNWTNNPQLWSLDWWKREYVEGSFKHSVRLDPYDNLESWFNWEPNAWNERGFTVAQGDGLWKHRDLGNIVHV